jgi:hypothetical protein
LGGHFVGGWDFDDRHQPAAKKAQRTHSPRQPILIFY